MHRRLAEGSMGERDEARACERCAAAIKRSAREQRLGEVRACVLEPAGTLAHADATRLELPLHPERERRDER